MTKKGNLIFRSLLTIRERLNYVNDNDMKVILCMSQCHQISFTWSASFGQILCACHVTVCHSPLSYRFIVGVDV